MVVIDGNELACVAGSVYLQTALNIPSFPKLQEDDCGSSDSESQSNLKVYQWLANYFFLL